MLAFVKQNEQNEVCDEICVLINILFQERKSDFPSVFLCS